MTTDMTTARAKADAGSAAVPLVRLSLLAVALGAATAAGAVAMRTLGDTAFMACALASGLIAVTATRDAERLPAAQALWIVVGVAVLLRLALIAIDPLLSSDIYRYVWDGRIQAAGINPYRYIPADAALAPLRDAAIYPHINRADYAVTIYPPVAQMFFLLVTRIGENLTTMRLALVGCDAVTAAIIVVLLNRLRKPISRVTAYLWHPLPLWQVANNGHVDALMTMLMMFGLLLAFSERRGQGAAAIALGALVKPFAVIALPMTWRPWDWKVPAIVIIVVLLCYLPYLGVGWGVFGYLTSGYLREEAFASGRAFWLLSLLSERVEIGRGTLATYLAVSAVTISALALRAAWRQQQPLEARLADFNALLLVFLFLLSPHYPWYMLMATPFTALRGGLPNWTLTIGAFLLQDEVDWDSDLPMLTRQSILFGLFLAGCAYVAWRQWRRRPASGEGSHELAGA